MRRAAALRLLGGFVTASLAGCASDCNVSAPPLVNARATSSRFGVQVYPDDDFQRAAALIAGCGGTLVRIGLAADLDFPDGVFAAASQQGLRVILLTDFAAQPVDAAAYATTQAQLQHRYVQYDPIWEIWNEPNLARYWNATPNVIAYSKLAIETAKALRGAGAKDIWSGGTSGVDIDWISHLKQYGVFDYVNGCAVHNYEDPCDATSTYNVALGLVPSNVLVHTTETCIADAAEQANYLRNMWFIHRSLGLPTMIWCELRDGTAGSTGAYALPYGLVDKNYTPKPSYRMAQSLLRGG